MTRNPIHCDHAKDRPLEETHAARTDAHEISKPSSEPADTGQTEPDEENMLTSFLKKQVEHRADSAKAFANDLTTEPDLRILLEEQIKLQRQVRGIRSNLIQIKQGLFVCQFLSVMTTGTLVALVCFAYFRPGVGFESSLSAIGNGPTTSTIQSGQRQLTKEEKEQKQRYQQLIFQLFTEAKKTVDKSVNTGMNVEGFLGGREAYVRLLTTFGETGEKLAEENAPREVNEILSKVVIYTEKLYAEGDETIETEELQREILAFCQS